MTLIKRNILRETYLRIKCINPANKVSSNIFKIFYKKERRKRKYKMYNLLFYKFGITTSAIIEIKMIYKIN